MGVWSRRLLTECRLISRIRSSPTSPFPIPSTSLILTAFRYNHDVPYTTFSIALFNILDDLLQNALQGELHEEDLIPTTEVLEWNEDGIVLQVEGHGLTVSHLGSSLRGLGQWVHTWGFDQAGISGVWTVEQLATGKSCDIRVVRSA